MRHTAELQSEIAPPTAMSSDLTDPTLELVHQAAAIVQRVKAEAHQSVARATDIATRATELLEAAEKRIKALEAAHSAAELNLREAQARLLDLETSTAQSLAFLKDALAQAQHRATSAERKVEETIHSVQNAIRKELLAFGSLPQTRLAAAA